ncbi:hypothetical protein OUZ56_012157 [Daphnia magna]|uniref:Uncharacterized protein n=1 Tax=Daphnia magna TaxID=35525 RepID=A0ABQ9Z270_9CRUS|nr:hypothetical protein OUZ56_012157 [Daphnia magna]
MFRRTRWAINVDNANRPTAVQRTMQPSRPQFSRGPIVVPPTQPPALVQQSGSSTVAVQSPPVTARPVAGVNTPSGQSSLFQSSAQQESTPGRSVEAPSRPVREIPASPARLFVSRIPVRDRVVWLPPSASSGQHAPVAALGVTRSGRRYIKPLPPSQWPRIVLSQAESTQTALDNTQTHTDYQDYNKNRVLKVLILSKILIFSHPKIIFGINKLVSDAYLLEKAENKHSTAAVYNRSTDSTLPSPHTIELNGHSTADVSFYEQVNLAEASVGCDGTCSLSTLT